MADIKYSVEVAYFSSGKIGNPYQSHMASAKAAERSFGSSDKSLGKAFSAMPDFGGDLFKGAHAALDSFTGAIVTGVEAAALTAGAALASGLNVAIKAGLKFNETIESATIGLATVADMQLGTGIEKGMRMASSVIEQARKDAQRLPGEFQDLIGIMTSAAPAALQRGVSMDRLEKISANAMAAAAAMNVPMAVAGRQLGMMFEGRATRAQAFSSRLGFKPKELNAMPDDKRADAIEKALAKAGPSIDLFAGSYAGLTSTAKDTARQFAGTFAAPLFGSIKGELGRSLEWFGSNQGEVDRFATTLGVGVDVAFHRGLDAMRKWVPIAVTFATTLEQSAERVIAMIDPYVRRGAAMAEHFMKDPNAGAKIGGVATAVVGAKVAFGAGDLGIDAMRSFAPLLSAAGYSASALGAAALPAAIGVAALGVSAAGAFDVLTDTSNEWHSFAMLQVAETSTEFKHLVESTAGLATAFRPIADLMGADLLLSINLTVGALDLVVGSMTAFYGGMKSLIELIPGVKTLNDTPLGGKGYPYSPTPWEQPLFPKFVEGIEDVEDKLAKRKAPNQTVHINGPITISVSSTKADPGRVAKETARALIDITRHPKVSREALSNRTVR